MCNWRVAGKTQPRGRSRGNRKQRAQLTERLPTWSGIKSAFRAFLRHRVRLLLAATASIALLGLGALIVVWLATSPRFDVKHFSAPERHWLPQVSLAERLQIDPPINLFRYDTEAAEARLEASPWVKRASVKRAFPDGLSVEIVENEPAAVALIGELYLVGDDGVPFKRATMREAASLGLVIVTGISRDDYRKDEERAASRVAAAIAVASLWSADSKHFRLAEVNVDVVRGFTLVAERGAPVVRLGEGEPERLAARVRLFDQTWAALNESERSTANFIHLDIAPVPTRVAIAFRSAGLEREEKHPWAK